MHGVDALIRIVDLPHPRRRGTLSVEEALAQRRSVRRFGSGRLTQAELSQLLWAAQGITSPWGERTSPSAGALYPLELYVATPDGLGQYRPDGHRLLGLGEADLRRPLTEAALSQSAVAEAAAVFAVTCVYERSVPTYGDRAERYITLEAGHAVQNVLLEAVALELAAVVLGAFDDAAVQEALGLPAEHAPLALVAVGRPREG